MSRSIDFDDGEASTRGVPRGEITLIGSGGPMGSRATFANALVDTGAKHSQFPELAATNIGVDLAGAITRRVSTANGPSPRKLVYADVEMNGIAAVGVPIYLTAANTFPELIGRSTLYALFNTIGFSSVDWLQELPGKPPPNQTNDDVATFMRALSSSGATEVSRLVVGRGEIEVEGIRLRRQ